MGLEEEDDMMRENADRAYDKGYRDGLEEGIRLYAWWKDGIQYVGTCGTTLKEALAKERIR